MTNRYFCWDDFSIENSNNVEIRSHKPQSKNLALVCQNEWEGNCNGYACVVKAQDKYLFYYRGCTFYDELSEEYGHDGGGVICVAESSDGITFKKPDLQIYEYNGTKNNNIVFMRGKTVDNFSVFYDENPNCPKNERFKALSAGPNDTLMYYCCGDGYHFEYKYNINVKGAFDSFNLGFWDKDSGEYCIYYRAFHTKDGVDKFSWVNDKIHPTEDIRDIRYATSKDFVNWTEHGRIIFAKDKEDYPLYTSQITKYYRSDNLRIGFPVRYFDRPEDSKNFDYLPMGDRHKIVTEKYGREGTSFTDCVIMTSTDGLNFDRRDEAFLTPGVENNHNWWYGNCYIAHGMIETEGEGYGAQNELSLYVPENYRIAGVNFRRYTIRIDGFFSWYGNYRGGEVLTKPIKIVSGEMAANFATSAGGGVVFTLCDLDGNELAGYKSYTLFGDTIERPVVFDKPLDNLIGKEVRIKINLKDAHLYSFVFK